MTAPDFPDWYLCTKCLKWVHDEYLDPAYWNAGEIVCERCGIPARPNQARPPSDPAAKYQRALERRRERRAELRQEPVAPAGGSPSPGL